MSSLIGQSNPTATSTELVFQVQNATTNNITKFRYSSVPGTAVLYETYNCLYTTASDFTQTHVIESSNTTDNYFASIITDDEDPVDLFEMIHALIKVEVIVGSTTKKYFYYDTRDCQYYTECEYRTGDVTVRYDYGNNNLWFKKDVVTNPTNASESTGWEEVSSTTKTWWEVHDYEHCIISAPQKPTGLTSSWSGIHPRLDWNANTESNLLKYNIFKQDVTSNFQYLASTTNTYYVDMYETKYSSGNTKQYIHYKIKAENTDNENSLSSDPVTAIVNGNDLDKVTSDNSKLNNDEILNYSLSENYPNPFNPSTIISYTIKDEGRVLLTIHNLLGELVAKLINETKPEGKYSIVFDANNLPNGIYFYKLTVNNFIAINKMILLK